MKASRQRAVLIVAGPLALGAALIVALVLALASRHRDSTTHLPGSATSDRPTSPAPASALDATAHAPSAPAARAPADPPGPSDPPGPPVPSGPLPKQTVLARARWGSGRGELGKSRAQEGNAEAPLALTVDARGIVSVLDQVNGRIARWDSRGKPLEPWPLTQQTARELVAGPDGTLALLDPTGDASVTVLGAGGRALGEAPIRGKGFPDPALATGLHLDDSGIWVEQGHALFTHVADAQGRPSADRAVLDGRPGRAGGVLLSAAIIEAAAGTAWVRTVDRAKQTMLWQRRYTLPAPILRLVLLDSDREGRIAFGLHLAREVEPGRFTDESIQVLCLRPDGAVRDVLVLPPPEGPEEAQRELALAEDGTILYLHRTAAEARLLRLRCAD